MEHSALTLSQSEWRVMESLWYGPKTLMELVRDLERSAGWAKSTVTTMVRRMEEKGLISYDQQGRTKVFRAAVSRDAVAARRNGLLAAAGISWQRGIIGRHTGPTGSSDTSRY